MMKKGEKSMKKKIKIRTEVSLCLSPKERKLLGKYVSPKSEHSHFKGMPMELYELATRLLPSKERRIKFKAKGKSVCKEFAETFSISYWSSFYLYLGGGFLHKPVASMSPLEFAAAEVTWETTREALELASEKRHTILSGGKW